MSNHLRSQVTYTFLHSFNYVYRCLVNVAVIVNVINVFNVPSTTLRFGSLILSTLQSVVNVNVYVNVYVNVFAIWSSCRSVAKVFSRVR